MKYTLIFLFLTGCSCTDHSRHFTQYVFDSEVLTEVLVEKSGVETSEADATGELTIILDRGVL